MSNIEPIIWEAIIDSVIAGRCVPFLGAGVNVSTENYKGLPLGSDVVLRIVKSLSGLPEDQLKELIKESNQSVKSHIDKTIDSLRQEKKKIPDGGGPLPSLLRVTLPDLSRVALQVEIKAGLPHLMKYVREILADEGVSPSPLLQTLGTMIRKDGRSPFKLIVTANYDGLLERAFDGKGYELVIQPIAGFTEKDQIELQNRLAKPGIGPILYKIHGSFKKSVDENDSRLILTEEDYIQFLSVVGRQDQGVPTLVSEKLINGTILFLGYSLEDWDFRTIFKTLIEPLPEIQRPKSYAIQLNPPEFWVRYWEKKGVTILDADIYDFAEELQMQWQDQVGV